MDFDVRILHRGLGEICAPLDLGLLENACPVWGEDLRNAQSVLSGSADGDRVPVWVAGACTSSMDAAWELIERESLPPWGAVIAVEQTAGRGQLRRPWASPPGNLHVSFRLPCPDPAWSNLLSLLIGYAFCAAGDDFGATLRLKWPNDLYQLSRKVGGILVEQRGATVVAGLGLNLAYAPGDCEMRKDAASSASVLQFESRDSGPLLVWLDLVNRAKNEYNACLENESPSGFLSQVTRRLLWLGKMIHYGDGEHWHRVRLLGLHRDGGLILERDGGSEVVYSGSILFERP